MAKTTSTGGAGSGAQAPQHISLYRKYRPSTFRDVIGQDHIVSVLEESIKQGKVGHAYLFCGSRGTGKTSVARIFAKALGTTANDLYEIDAASNTSVDDIRELTEAVNTVPFESRYKVYILDEVHMLSKAAFNAFLKTLEEPPKHVIFVLATTEMEKLPDTIVSRCEQYIFRKPTTDILKKVVLDISKKEDAPIEPAAAELVALLGDGSFRDTLSILQKVLTFGAKSLEDVEKITGAPKSALILDFVGGLLTGKSAEAFGALRKAGEDNLDMKIFAELSMTRLRYVLAKKISEHEAKALAGDFSEGDLKALGELATGATLERAAGILRALLRVYHSIGKTYIKSLPLELVIADIMAASEKGQ